MKDAVYYVATPITFDLKNKMGIKKVFLIHWIGQIFIE